MRSTRDILEEYRRADLEKRLNLFLACPSLRTEFSKIDQNSTKGGSSLKRSDQEENLARRA